MQNCRRCIRGIRTTGSHYRSGRDVLVLTDIKADVWKKYERYEDNWKLWQKYGRCIGTKRNKNRSMGNI